MNKKFEELFATMEETQRNINKLKMESLKIDAEFIGFIIGFSVSIVISLVRIHKLYKGGDK